MTTEHQTLTADAPHAQVERPLPAPTKIQKKSLILTMAEKYGMEAATFSDTVKHTIMPPGKAGQITDPEFAAFLMVAQEYNLNPVTREIFAFPRTGGGIMTVVSIDGWIRIINEKPQLDGIQFSTEFSDAGKVSAITCRIYRSDRKLPVEITEYMDECFRATEPWKKWPARMLRHKALIQCARYAFGFAGLVEQDEAERENEAREKNVTPVAEAQEKMAQIKGLLGGEK